MIFLRAFRNNEVTGKLGGGAYKVFTAAADQNRNESSGIRIIVQNAVDFIAVSKIVGVKASHENGIHTAGPEIIGELDLGSCVSSGIEEHKPAGTGRPRTDCGCETNSVRTLVRSRRETF